MTISERYNASTLLDANLAAGRSARTALYCGEEHISYLANWIAPPKSGINQQPFAFEYVRL